MAQTCHQQCQTFQFPKNLPPLCRLEDADNGKLTFCINPVINNHQSTCTMFSILYCTSKTTYGLIINLVIDTFQHVDPLQRKLFLHSTSSISKISAFLFIQIIQYNHISSCVHSVNHCTNECMSAITCQKLVTILTVMMANIIWATLKACLQLWYVTLR